MAEEHNPQSQVVTQEQTVNDQDFKVQDAIDQEHHLKSLKGNPEYFTEQMFNIIEQTGSLPDDFGEKLNQHVDEAAREARFNAMHTIFDRMAELTKNTPGLTLPDRPQVGETPKTDQEKNDELNWNINKSANEAYKVATPVAEPNLNDLYAQNHLDRGTKFYDTMAASETPFAPKVETESPDHNSGLPNTDQSSSNQ